MINETRMHALEMANAVPAQPGNTTHEDVTKRAEAYYQFLVGGKSETFTVPEGTMLSLVPTNHTDLMVDGKVFVLSAGTQIQVTKKS